MIICPGGEMVDTLALGASAKSVGVRVPPRAPINLISNIAGYGNGIRLVS